MSSEWPCVVALYTFLTQVRCPPHNGPLLCYTLFYSVILFSILLAWKVLRSLGYHWNYLETVMNPYLLQLISILSTFFLEGYLLVWRNTLWKGFYLLLSYVFLLLWLWNVTKHLTWYMGLIQRWSFFLFWCSRRRRMVSNYKWVSGDPFYFEFCWSLFNVLLVF